MTTQESGDSGGNPKGVGFGQQPDDLIKAELIRAERISRKPESTRDLGSLAGTSVDIGYVRKLTEELEDLIARKELADEELSAIESRADDLRPYIDQLSAGILTIQRKIVDATLGPEENIERGTQ